MCMLFYDDIVESRGWAILILLLFNFVLLFILFCCWGAQRYIIQYCKQYVFCLVIYFICTLIFAPLFIYSSWYLPTIFFSRTCMLLHHTRCHCSLRPYKRHLPLRSFPGRVSPGSPKSTLTPSYLFRPSFASFTLVSYVFCGSSDFAFTRLCFITDLEPNQLGLLF